MLHPIVHCCIGVGALYQIPLPLSYMLAKQAHRWETVFLP